MQTILGSGGAIGTELARALREHTDHVRLVSRSPEKVHPEDKLFPANLLLPADVDAAVNGSEVVYLTVGLEYNLKVWQTDWPVIIANVIESCIKHDCKLVFFDNVYMYSQTGISHMTEDTQVTAPSKKGCVRAEISETIMKEVWTGMLTALIARSADFYGPRTNNSILTETVFKPLSEGKKANWLGSADKRHSYTYTPDAGKATALLGNTPDAFNQVWHLPTASNPFTGKEWITAIAGELGVAPRYRTVPRFMVRIMGFFMPVMKETVEMMYQYEQDYVFDSSKFEQRFDTKPTPYIQGIREVVATGFFEPDESTSG